MGIMSDALTRGPEGGGTERKCRAPEEQTMTKDFQQRGPAKIYQFPIRPRPALGGYREDGRPGETSAAAVAASGVAVAACGSAWYHEEALRDAGPSSKN